ncbi:DbpA/DbpB family decorin-binding adhesin [Borrelia sp. RT1S]|uniref:DbpA/DbpB family decorin-binding adhesin n=1 Tax=Borrelia sp. RT1S TaxID=2898580 RepID=UPI001E6047E2|nr:DbpA/DbpB family decorin-binding adhesin [Borrelia sp. RT1S]UGQ17763.1 DbpA/DbpB family decorin-binding adhesin [Borrelia sp. RT1S]
MLRMIPIFVLLASCSMLPSHLKTKVDSSSIAAKNQIDAIVKESGFTFDSLQKETGSKGAGDNRIQEVKLKVIEVAEEFLGSMEEVIEALGTRGTEVQFLEVYSQILKVAESLEKIGIQKATVTVKQAVEGGEPTDPYGKIKNVHNKLLVKLQSVKQKQKLVNKKKDSE